MACDSPVATFVWRVAGAFLSSVITSKAANGYQFKTGHRTSVRDKRFERVQLFLVGTAKVEIPVAMLMIDAINQQDVVCRLNPVWHSEMRRSILRPNQQRIGGSVP